MPARINQQPGGILGLLGIKNGGRNPEELATILAPVFDVSAYYLEANAQFVQVLADAQLGLNIFAQVPEGEVWYVHHASAATGALAAADYFQTQMAISTANNLDWVGVGEPAGGDPTYAVACCINRPFLLGPGMQMCRYDLVVTTATTIPVLSNVRYTAMRV